MNRKRLASWFAGLVLAIPLLASPPAVNANSDYAACMNTCKVDDNKSTEYCQEVCRGK